MQNPYEKRMLRVLEHIHTNPAGDLSLDVLADIAAMSRFHWHRVFHGMTGETCAQAVRRIRLNRAACWLVQTGWPIEQVAARAGYPTPQSFGRAFRSGYGMSPSEFRKKGRAEAPQLHQRERTDRMYDVTIEDSAGMRLVGRPHQGPYIEIGSAFEALSAIASARGLWPQVIDMVGIYMDDPSAVPAADLRSFAGLALHPEAAMPEGLEAAMPEGLEAPVPEGLEPRDIPAGPVARLRFTGPYAGLHAGYEYLYGVWLPGSGREPADHPCFEVYRNMPADTAPQDLITDICLPLRPS